MKKTFVIFLSLILLGCLATTTYKVSQFKETTPPPAAPNTSEIQQANCEGLFIAYTQQASQYLVEECYEQHKKSICLKTDKDCLNDLKGFCWTSVRLLLVGHIQSCIENKQESWHEYPTKSDPFPTSL